jgi:nucleoside-diphosphate kinase
MALERTFSIIKPDATASNVTGTINAMIEKAGLRIIAQKRIRMSREQAETFYAVHRQRPFFGELVDFMISRSSSRCSKGQMRLSPIAI